MPSKVIWPTRTEDIRERQRFRLNQNDDNFEKANKVTDGTEDNIVILTEDGDIQDSGIGIDEIVIRNSNVVYVSSDYQILSNDEKVYIICSGADITVTLPIETENRTYEIEKIDSTEFKGIVSGQSGELVNGESTFELLMQFESVKPTKTSLTITGSDWLI